MESCFKSGHIVWRALLLVTVFAVSILASSSNAAAQQTQAAFTEPGYPICGALNLRTNKLLGPCSFSSATKTGKAVGECPRGSFFDIGTWSCFSCPAGYNRTGFAVDTPKACSKQVSAQYKPATRVGSHRSCPSGSFRDPRNGGECWSCPAGFGRTWSAVDAWDACGKAGQTARRAEFISRVCPDGTITDLNGSCYTCPEGFRRTAAAVTAGNACFRNESLMPAEKTAALTCKPGEHFDFIDGGTCWSCPEDAVRSVYDVRTDKACEYTTMRWVSAKRTPNGLFALPGAPEIAAQVIKARTGIDAMIAKFISENKLSKAEGEEFATDSWIVINKTPENSPILKAVVFEHIFNAIKNGAKTKADRDLLNYLAVYVQQSRQFLANEMRDVWESWKRGRAAWKTQFGSTRANTHDTGVAPPKIQTMVADAMHLAPAGIMALTFLGGYGGSLASNTVAHIAHKVSHVIYSANKILSQGASSLAKAAASPITGMGPLAAPLASLAVSSVIFSMATDIALEQNKQDAIVNDALIVAQRPVNLSRLIMTEEGRIEIANNWAMMTQEPIKPNTALWARLMPSETSTTESRVVLNGEKVIVGAPDIPVIPMAQINAITPTTTAGANASDGWENVSGKATDIAIGADGTAYVISPTKVNSSGYQIYKRESAANKWTKLPGAGYRIAVSDTTAWVINLRGQIYSLSGSNWQHVSGPQAKDIGASAKGVWIVDFKGKIHKREGNGWKNVPGIASRIDIDQDGRPWAVDEKGSIWVHSNNLQWQRLPGQGIDVAVDVPGKATVIDKSGNIFVYDGTKRNWVATSREEDAQAIGAGGGQVWRVTKNNDIYRLR